LTRLVSDAYLEVITWLVWKPLSPILLITFTFDFVFMRAAQEEGAVQFLSSFWTFGREFPS